MGDYNAVIIPADPRFVPKKAAVTAAVGILRKLAPKADEIEAMTDAHVQFRDCGGNFERILCPACGTEIDTEAWQAWLDGDWSEAAHHPPALLTTERPDALPVMTRGRSQPLRN